METYELFALRYATRVGRRPEFFLGGVADKVTRHVTEATVWIVD